MAHCPAPAVPCLFTTAPPKAASSSIRRRRCGHRSVVLPLHNLAAQAQRNLRKSSRWNCSRRPRRDQALRPRKRCSGQRQSGEGRLSLGASSPLRCWSAIRAVRQGRLARLGLRKRLADEAHHLGAQRTISRIRRRRERLAEVLPALESVAAALRASLTRSLRWPRGTNLVAGLHTPNCLRRACLVSSRRACCYSVNSPILQALGK
jgi:hypothetical protein